MRLKLIETARPFTNDRSSSDRTSADDQRHARTDGHRAGVVVERLPDAGQFVRLVVARQVVRAAGDELAILEIVESAPAAPHRQSVCDWSASRKDNTKVPPIPYTRFRQHMKTHPPTMHRFPRERKQTWQWQQKEMQRLYSDYNHRTRDKAM